MPDITFQIVVGLDAATVALFGRVNARRSAFGLPRFTVPARDLGGAP